ncbi:uracil-DNA glycosylase [Corynebacterium urogenitale]
MVSHSEQNPNDRLGQQGRGAQPAARHDRSHQRPPRTAGEQFSEAVKRRAEELVAQIHPDWELPHLHIVLAKALAEAEAGQRILPAQENILRAFRVPPSEVRVLIVGQDPYPTPGHAVGLSFSAELPRGVPFPKSLVNIFTEYEQDLGLPRPQSADLSPWLDQGVMLLNRVLTVRAGQAGSHRNGGWEQITEAAVRQISENPQFAAILWGRPAQQLAPIIGKECCVMSPHPSPLSAYRGFFGSKPFSRVNQILVDRGADPVDWALNR